MFHLKELIFCRVFEFSIVITLKQFFFHLYIIEKYSGISSFFENW